MDKEFDPTYKYPDSMVEEYDEEKEKDLCYFDKKKGIVGTVSRTTPSKMADVWKWITK